MRQKRSPEGNLAPDVVAEAAARPLGTHPERQRGAAPLLPTARVDATRDQTLWSDRPPVVTSPPK
jgi:hypothetical protein